MPLYGAGAGGQLNEAVCWWHFPQIVSLTPRGGVGSRRVKLHTRAAKLVPRVKPYLLHVFLAQPPGRFQLCVGLIRFTHWRRRIAAQEQENPGSAPPPDWDFDSKRSLGLNKSSSEYLNVCSPEPSCHSNGQNFSLMTKCRIERGGRTAEGWNTFACYSVFRVICPPPLLFKIL